MKKESLKVLFGDERVVVFVRMSFVDVFGVRHGVERWNEVAKIRKKVVVTMVVIVDMVDLIAWFI